MVRNEQTNKRLTVRINSLDGASWLGRLAHSSSVLSNDPELVFTSFRKVHHSVHHVTHRALVDTHPA